MEEHFHKKGNVFHTVESLLRTLPCAAPENAKAAESATILTTITYY